MNYTFATVCGVYKKVLGREGYPGEGGGFERDEKGGGGGGGVISNIK